MELSPGIAHICTEHPEVMVVYRTEKCPLCKLINALETLGATAKEHEVRIMELKLKVEELWATYGKTERIM